MVTHDFTVEQGGKRIDVYLAEHLQDLSRSHIRKLIDSGHVTINSLPARASQKVQPNDAVTITIPPPEPMEVAAEEIPLAVVYEDEHLLVVDKPRGMTVHPAPGSRHGTLVNAILAYSDDLSGIGGVERPGIVHRLDKDTTGLLVVAKTDQSHASLQTQIQQRTAERRYVAMVWGATTFNEAVVDAPIGRHPSDRQKMAVIRDTGRYTARDAVTHLNVLERFGHFTLLEAKLDTGRTHQIRVHCSFIGHPVVGDPVYGGAKRAVPSAYSKMQHKELQHLIEGLGGQALHARTLAFEHPVSGERMTFEAPLPEEFVRLIEWLREAAIESR